MDAERMAKKLQKCRGDRTQKQVAEEMGINYFTYRSYESGGRIPGDEFKVKIADYYGVSIEWLFFR